MMNAPIGSISVGELFMTRNEFSPRAMLGKVLAHDWDAQTTTYENEYGTHETVRDTLTVWID